MLDRNFESLIFNFMEMVCNDLNVEMPGVGVDKSIMNTNTTMAVFLPATGDIFLNPDYCVMEALHLMYFSVAHELRHKWQRDKGENFINYKKSSDISLKDYNNQALEKDANTYAINYLDKYFFGWDIYGIHDKLKKMGAL